MFVIEFLNNIGETVEQGDVLVISGRQRSLLKNQNYMLQPEVDIASKEYDTRVCGIVCSTKVEFIAPEPEEAVVTEPAAAETATAGETAESGDQSHAASPSSSTDGESDSSAEPEPEEDYTRIKRGQAGLMVILGAFPYCKADASYGAIKVGDLLTTSQTKGHARKVTDADKANGAIIGKALGALKEGTGIIPVLVTIQ